VFRDRISVFGRASAAASKASTAKPTFAALFVLIRN